MNNKLELGLIVELTENVEESFAKVTDFGLTTCQLMSWRPHILDEVLGERVRAAVQQSGVRISSYWAGHSGTTKWNFIDGPSTIGLVPPKTRQQRIDELKQGAQFARWINVPSITTHVGFIPENPQDPAFRETVDAVRQVAQRCKDLGLMFCFETGQETPTTLLRTIDAVNTGNLGINLDPANLLMYGKANPFDAVNLFGGLIVGLHAKDGEYPTTASTLGAEKPLGLGHVGFDRLIPRLKDLGFKGPITIEREVSGEQQYADIHHAIKVLTPLL